MNDMVANLFGVGTDLTATQMALRGLAVFALTLLMIRISGRRSIGQHSSFDACIPVLLGSVLARCVVGASPFWPTIATGVALVLLHRAIAMLSLRVPRFDVLVNGRPRTLVIDGTINHAAMRKGLVSSGDLLQALREHSVPEDLSLARQIVLERNGAISVLER
jgi:uncharacterized membrane protein YcaP (DUF421 family)